MFFAILLLRNKFTRRTFKNVDMLTKKPACTKRGFYSAELMHV